MMSYSRSNDIVLWVERGLESKVLLEHIKNKLCYSNTEDKTFSYMVWKYLYFNQINVAYFKWYYDKNCIFPI